MILEVSKGSIDARKLTECQGDARSGLYTEAMAGFLQWFAERNDQRRTAFGARVSDHRAKSSSNTAHARTPEIVANLQAAFEMFLEFGVASGAIDDAEADRLSDRCWDSLREAAVAQAKHQGETEPTARFLSLLRSVLSSGRAHLAARNGGEPGRTESCGWRRDTSGKWMSLGDRIGWVDDGDLYLDPTAAYRVAQMAGRDMGEVLAVSEPTLKKRLHEKGLLASVDQKRQTLTVRPSIGGPTKDVLHFLRSTVLPEVSDGDEDAE